MDVHFLMQQKFQKKGSSRCSTVGGQQCHRESKFFLSLKALPVGKWRAVFFPLKEFASLGTGSLSQKPPQTTSLHVSFIRTGWCLSQLLASQPGWLPPNRIYLPLELGEEWASPESQSQRDICGGVGRQCLWDGVLVCPFLECLLCATIVLGNLASAYVWTLCLCVAIESPLETWAN